MPCARVTVLHAVHIALCDHVSLFTILSISVCDYDRVRHMIE